MLSNGYYPANIAGDTIENNGMSLWFYNASLSTLVVNLKYCLLFINCFNSSYPPNYYISHIVTSLLIN